MRFICTDESSAIYPVFTLGGGTQDQVGTVREVGGSAYGKWLNTTTELGYVIPG